MMDGMGEMMGGMTLIGLLVIVLLGLAVAAQGAAQRSGQ
jgi:hypothetical protein